MGYIFDQKHIPEVVSQLKKDHQKVVLTHGVFDLFHPGHLSFLRKSRQLADVQIVGVDDDDLVRRFKGDKRPIIHDLDRAHILACLNLVDFVFIIKNKININSGFFINFYRKIRPDYVSYGKTFSFSHQYSQTKNMIRRVNYREIDSCVPGNPPPISTSDIIQKIRNT